MYSSLVVGSHASGRIGRRYGLETETTKEGVSTAVAETVYTTLVWQPDFASSVFNTDDHLMNGRRSWNKPVDILRDVSEAMS
jgi:hypothetical protein